MLLIAGLYGGSGRPQRAQRRGEFLPEFIELAGIDIADRPQVEACLAPVADVKALHDFVFDAVDRGAQLLRDEQIDDVGSALIDKRSNLFAIDGIEQWPPSSVNPCAVRSGTGGARATLPLNHGFTAPRSVESTSARWSGCNDRRCADTTSLAIC